MSKVESNVLSSLVGSLLKKAYLCDGSAKVAGWGLNPDLTYKSILIWHSFCDSANDPGTTRCRVIHYKNHISRNKVASNLHPLVALLKLRQIFFNPSLPKQIRYVLDLSPSFPCINIIFLK
ncbi:hypothetical protein XENOCAPTIV_013543 [Xenoophorus captivus]|uniref:Uncharacterized protein n=1 Tax=Xenoophorus captivus TaxID=1517983 RepID=A0ABV0RJ86_9TELE